MDLNDLKTVCFALGPYRNLTTLTASLLFLHPKCQVLNHGSDWILPNPKVNFLIGYTDEKFNAFIRLAIDVSEEGRRGRHGGSIMLSHAFDDEIMQETYNRRFTGTKIKEEISCLFWKESFRVSAFIRQQNINLGALFSKNEQIRFLMPIRNPIDCALSNMKSGHAQALVNGGDAGAYADVLNVILLEIRWFIRLQERYPDRFFCFFENDFDSDTVRSLANFLEIGAEATWVDDVIRNYNIRHPYEYTKSMKDDYINCVNRIFERDPGVIERLRSFFG